MCEELRFGLIRPIENEASPVEAPKGPLPGPLEDSAPHKLWVWECVLLDGLPAAFREAARRDREARQVPGSSITDTGQGSNHSSLCCAASASL